MPIQLQIVAILLAVGFFVLTIRLTRKDHAEVRQMNKWLILALILLVGALFPSLGNKVADLFGITTLTSLALFVLTGVLLVFSLTTSITLINTERRVKRLTQELSLLKKELKDLENK